MKVLIALIAIGVILILGYAPCWNYFGMGYCDLFMEIFLVAIAALATALIVSIPFVIASIKLKKMKVVLVPFVCFFVIAFVIFGSYQIRASHKLSKIKQEFWEIALSGEKEMFGTGEYGDEGEICGYDFGGSLTRILDKRDAALLPNGYIIIGKWWTGDRGTRTGMLYIYCPPIANRLLRDNRNNSWNPKPIDIKGVPSEKI